MGHVRRIQASPLDTYCAVLLVCMEFKNEWSGSTTELMEGLETTAGELKLGTTTRYWPKGPNILSRKLNEVKTNLMEIGIEIERGKKI